MAAVLAGGPAAYLSHRSAAALWRMRREFRGPVDVSLLADVFRHPEGIRAHRRPNLPPEDVTAHRGIPVTTPTRTLIDLATALTPNQLEAAVNEADVLGLIDPETLRAESRAPQRPARRPPPARPARPPHLPDDRV